MKKILVIGELCIDRFVYGDTKRLSPEAPVPVFNPIETIENKGMAGNVVENVKSLYETAKYYIGTKMKISLNQDMSIIKVIICL